MQLLTAAQMRAVERAAMESGSVTGLDLMERAGRGSVEAIFEWRTDLARGRHRAVVLCGPGNNGGDGFAVARLLAERGWSVEVFFYGDAARLPPDAAENARRWRRLGIVRDLTFPALTEEDADALSNAAYRISETALVVDALFGTGLTRPIAGLRPILEANDCYACFTDLMPARTVSLDMPSGICADSGRVIAAADAWPGAVQAAMTVTFHTPKPGHYLAEGPVYCGQLFVKDIGL